ncbi:sigma-70 family RNA polymerase sigma factor [Streptomyces roseoverticillatus]|nr:sigma-70 family RNA polymerase sigma factor [Streptomyces roseoverticillatus]
MGKGSGVSDEEVRRVSEALDEVERIADPEARVQAMSRVMADQVKRNVRWKDERSQMVFKLKSEGLSLRKIADRVGTSLGTVQDILRGHSGSWKDRPKKKATSGPDE